MKAGKMNLSYRMEFKYLPLEKAANRANSVASMPKNFSQNLGLLLSPVGGKLYASTAFMTITAQGYPLLICGRSGFTLPSVKTLGNEITLPVYATTPCYQKPLFL